MRGDMHFGPHQLLFIIYGTKKTYILPCTVDNDDVDSILDSKENLIAER